MSQVDFLQEREIVYIKGCVDFETALPLFNKGIALIEDDTYSKVCFDLQGVLPSSNSGLLAVLLGWRRASVKHKKDIALINPPDFLASLARLCGVENMLFLKESEK